MGVCRSLTRGLTDMTTMPLYQVSSPLEYLCSNCGEDHASGQFPNCSAKREIESSQLSFQRCPTLFLLSLYNESDSQSMVIYVDNFSSQEERPARPVRQDETSDLNKTAVNKGVWEFGTGLLGPPGLQLQRTSCSQCIPGACGVLTPPIVKAIP